MNWQHLQAFVWLRRRLLANQWRRAGTVNAVFMTIFFVGALVLSVPLFFGSLALGIYAIPKALPIHLLFVADGVIVGFLFCWAIGLMAELQRTESLSLSKFMHLPVSVGGAFLINYLSSWLRLSLIVFVPVLFGFGLALVFTKGALALMVLPSMAAFLLMVTALTYQLQGWLASLMSNPRRRRTVVVATTAVFVLLVQLPNFLNMLRPWGGIQQPINQSAKLAKEMAELVQAYNAQEFDAAEFQRRQDEITQRHLLAVRQVDRESLKSVEEPARLLNQVLPVGWLPLGVMAVAEGRLAPGLLGCLGMTLIGSASLWRAYRTTLGLYQGTFTSGQSRPAAKVASPVNVRKPGVLLLERRLAGLSEPVSAIALGGLRSLVRSPESKMMLIMPLVMGGIFGALIWRAQQHLPTALRPAIAIGGMFMALMGAMQLMANQFGFDRDGFRVFVLSAAPRRDILLGKNLAFAPLALGMVTLLLIVVQVVSPLRLDHVLAMFPQFISMFLLFCLLTNLISIYAPMHVAAGSMQPASHKLIPVLIQLAMFGFLFPLLEVPTLLPLAIEVALPYLGWTTNAPVCLVLALVECAVVVVLYRFALNWQGNLLQAREQKILEVVTNR